jgi:hypothetical protein
MPDKRAILMAAVEAFGAFDAIVARSAWATVVDARLAR